mgnify:FL=1
MSLEYIRNTYKVPAKKGQRVLYTGGGAAIGGTIVGSRDASLRVRTDDGHTGFYHPTWEMQYPVQEQSHD